MKKLIILSLIITSLFVISCKGSGGGDSGSSTNTTTTPANTPLQGSWRVSGSEDVTIGCVTATVSATITYTFTGNAISVAYVTSTTGSGTTATESFAAAGTFRLDGNNLYTTFKTASYTDGTQTLTDVAAIEAEMLSLPVQVDNTEHLFGTYAVNGNTLTLTPTGNSAQNFTKQ